MFAVIAIPDFSLQAVLRHEPERRGWPVALVDEDSTKSPVTQVTAAARRFAVTPGITSTQAKARCEKIAFRLRSAAQEESAQEILLECAYAFAAYIESTAPGICTLDLRGLPILKAENLPGTLDAWAGQLLERLERFQLAGRIGIAANPALAVQATYGDGPINFVRDARKFWSGLSIQHFCSSAEILEVLRKWGITTVAGFLALGKDKIAERLGVEGVHLFEGARAEKIRPLNLTAPRKVYEEFFEFENPVETLEPLLFIVRRFLDQLTRRVELGSLVIQDLTVSLKLESGTAQDRTLKIPAPTRDIEVLFRIVHNYLETVRTPSAVIGISMRAQPCPAETQQFQLFETAVRDPNRFYETIGRLDALLGADRIGTPVLRDSFKPEDFALEPIAAHSASSAAHAHQQSTTFDDTAPFARGLLLRRFRPPLPSTVKLQEGQPTSVRNARFHASVVRSAGPFRISGNWWENLWAREEWDIETKQGDLLRLIRENNEWLVEGAYD
jgi:protein ImuB